MPNKDILNNETSLSVSLEDNGVKLKAKSRAISGLDRLFGNLFDIPNAALEARAAKRSAISEGEVKMIKAATEYGLSKMKLDPELAGRAVQNHFSKLFAAQANKDAVGTLALEDLRVNPPNDDEAGDGPAELDPSFLNRLERYAAEASEEEVRQRWAKVLSSEVRKPGSFSSKVMRIIDELDNETAIAFQSLCTNELGGAVPVCLSGELPFQTRIHLANADLIVDPGIAGHLRLFYEGEQADGKKVWVGKFAPALIVLPYPMATDLGSNPAAALVNHNGVPAVPAYLLTEAGKSISQLIERDQQAAARRLVAKIKETASADSVNVYPLSSLVP